MYNSISKIYKKYILIIDYVLKKNFNFLKNYLFEDPDLVLNFFPLQNRG